MKEKRIKRFKNPILFTLILLTLVPFLYCFVIMTLFDVLLILPEKPINYSKIYNNAPVIDVQKNPNDLQKYKNKLVILTGKVTTDRKIDDGFLLLPDNYIAFRRIVKKYTSQNKWQDVNENNSVDWMLYNTYLSVYKDVSKSPYSSPVYVISSDLRMGLVNIQDIFSYAYNSIVYNRIVTTDDPMVDFSKCTHSVSNRYKIEKDNQQFRLIPNTSNKDNIGDLQISYCAIKSGEQEATVFGKLADDGVTISQGQIYFKSLDKVMEQFSNQTSFEKMKSYLQETPIKTMLILFSFLLCVCLLSMYLIYYGLRLFKIQNKFSHLSIISSSFVTTVLFYSGLIFVLSSKYQNDMNEFFVFILIIVFFNIYLFYKKLK